MKLRKVLFLILIIISASCKQKDVQSLIDVDEEKEKINLNIDNWHKAASQADFDTYFNLMTKDGVFIGTDATENWNNAEFRAFSKPYFDKGKAWSFSSLDRNIYFSDNYETAWFDELLDTQMGICRGSGVIKIEDDQWKIAHYVLSMTIPNDQVKEIVSNKKMFDSLLVSKYKR